MGGQDIHGVKLYLAYDEDDDRYYWTNTNMEASVTRFVDVPSLISFSLTRREFTLVLNTTDDLLMPELLFNMNIPTIRIEEVVYFEPVQTLDFSTAMTEYKTRKEAFDIAQKELGTI